MLASFGQLTVTLINGLGAFACPNDYNASMSRHLAAGPTKPLLTENDRGKAPYTKSGKLLIINTGEIMNYFTNRSKLYLCMPPYEENTMET